MNHLEHMAFCATRAETSGFPHFAAALRDLLAKELERCPRAEFFQFVLGLPHEATVESVYVDGELFHEWEERQQFGQNEYLKSFEEVCRCKCVPVSLPKEDGANWVEREWAKATQMRSFAKYSSHPVTQSDLERAENILKADSIAMGKINADEIKWECLQAFPGTLCNHEFCKPRT